MRNELRFRVRVKSDFVDTQVLQRSIASFAGLASATGLGRWVVSDLRLSSVTVSARPIDRTDIEVEADFLRLMEGLSALAEVAEAPAGWDDELLESVAALEQVTSHHAVEGIDITLGDRPAISIHPATPRNAQRVLQEGSTSYGTVTGIVDRFLSRDSRREFGLVDEATGNKVTVRFDKDVEDDAKSWIGRRLTAWGMLRRTPGGKKKELRMEGFSLVPQPESLDVDKVVGALGAEWTGGLTSVDWIRGQRAEE